MRPLRSGAIAALPPDDAPASPSLWSDDLGPGPRREPLASAAAVDVAVVGAGYTGLWTAYYLLEADPALQVLVIERDHVGFGASGRNGGWCIGELAVGIDRLVAAGGRERAAELLRALHATVDEVGRVIERESIHAGFARGGSIRLARNGAQAERQRAHVERHRDLGLGPEVIRLVDRDEAVDHLAATRVEGGLWFAPTAALQPLALVRGLADAVEARGGRIVEGTAATGVGPGIVETEVGTVRAPIVVRATEGYTASLTGERRRLLPLSSLMVATEPIDADRWDAIGLRRRETFADDRHLVIYGQRTADDRIAFGGRGAPYRYGSATGPSTEGGSSLHAAVEATLRDLLPQLDGVAVTHHWGGVLGVPRDWFPAVDLDRATGLATAGGYVGEGVAAANLAGRTLAELIVGRPGALAGLPWVGHRARRWEPEPLRWLGVNAGLALAAAADRAEDRTGRPGWRSRAVGRLVG